MFKYDTLAILLNAFYLPLHQLTSTAFSPEEKKNKLWIRHFNKLFSILSLTAQYKNFDSDNSNELYENIIEILDNTDISPSFQNTSSQILDTMEITLNEICRLSSIEDTVHFHNIFSDCNSYQIPVLLPVSYAFSADNLFKAVMEGFIDIDSCLNNTAQKSEKDIAAINDIIKRCPTDISTFLSNNFELAQLAKKKQIQDEGERI